MEVVGFQDGDGAKGAAVIKEDALPGTLTLAVESLDIACRDLDDAVFAMSNDRNDDVMASPRLVALLLRVVTARRHVKRLELEVKAEIRESARASTMS